MLNLFVNIRVSCEKYRRYKICPVKNCQAKPQLKLSYHIKLYHKNVTPRKRKQYCRCAKVVTRNQVLCQRKLNFTNPSTSTTISAASTSIPTASTSPSASNTSPLPSPSSKKQSTRNMNSFPSNLTLEFENYLQSVDGGIKSKKTASVVVKDISKYLYFADPMAINWMTLVDESKIHEYFEVLRKKYKLGPEGRLTKMERHGDALKYLRLKFYENDNLIKKISHVDDILSRWKYTLRREKKKKNHERVQMLADSSKLDVDKLRKFVNNTRMWTKFNSIISQCKNKTIPSEDSLKFSVSAVTLVSLFGSWQRPGAVKNLTVSQYKSGTMLDGTYVVNITNHKTGVGGVANLMFKDEVKQRVDDYLEYIRPHLILEDNQHDNLFLQTNGRPIYKVGHLTRYMESCLKIEIPSATEVRKMGATEAAKTRTEEEVRIVARQMSHDPRTAAKYYQHIRGVKYAKQAFDTMESIVAPPIPVS